MLDTTNIITHKGIEVMMITIPIETMEDKEVLCITIGLNMMLQMMMIVIVEMKDHRDNQIIIIRVKEVSLTSLEIRKCKKIDLIPQ